MKHIFISCALLLAATYAHAGAYCAEAAKEAAANVYPGVLNSTRTKTVEDNRVYDITTGIGNREFGPRTYRVTFRDDRCNSMYAEVREVNCGKDDDTSTPPVQD